MSGASAKLGPTQHILEEDQASIIVQDGDTTYFLYTDGVGHTGDTDQAIWKIRKSVKTTFVGKTAYLEYYADGDLEFDNIADNVLTLTYA